MRLILALQVPELTLTDIRFEKLKKNMENKKIEYRWVPDGQLHIPLVELGDMGRGSFLTVFEKLKDVLAKQRPFDLKLSGLWGHPYQNEADMLWIGVQNSRYLRALIDDVADGLEIESDSFFRPHIPLVYLKRKRDVSDIISPFKKFDFGRILIDDVKILEKLSAGAGVRMMARYSLYDPPSDSAASFM